MSAEYVEMHMNVARALWVLIQDAQEVQKALQKALLFPATSSIETQFNWWSTYLLGLGHQHLGHLRGEYSVQVSQDEAGRRHFVYNAVF